MRLRRQENSSRKPNLEDYFPLVKSIASKVFLKTPPNVEFEDLLQEGYIGLIEAWRSFDPDKHPYFGTYAYHRIQGRMKDYLRKLDPLSRHQRTKVKNNSPDVEELKNISFVDVEEAYNVSAPENVESEIIKKSLLERSEKILLSFGDRGKKAILYFFEGLQMKEIADLYGVSESAISYSIRTVIRDLKSCF